MTMQDVQEGAAVYFDGTSSRKHQVTLRLGAALEIVEDGAVVATWPFEAIRRADGSAVNRLRLSCTAAAPLARLEIEDPATIAAVTARCSALDVDRGGPRQTARIVFWSARPSPRSWPWWSTACRLIADRLAPLVPYSVEQRIGEAVDLQVRTLFGDKVCEAPEGKAAFAAMVEKLRIAGGIEHPLDAHVLQYKIAERHRAAGRQDLPVRRAAAEGGEPGRGRRHPRARARARLPPPRDARAHPHTAARRSSPACCSATSSAAAR